MALTRKEQLGRLTRNNAQIGFSEQSVDLVEVLLEFQSSQSRRGSEFNRFLRDFAPQTRDSLLHKVFKRFRHSNQGFISAKQLTDAQLMRRFLDLAAKHPRLSELDALQRRGMKATPAKRFLREEDVRDFYPIPDCVKEVVRRFGDIDRGARFLADFRESTKTAGTTEKQRNARETLDGFQGRSEPETHERGRTASPSVEPGSMTTSQTALDLSGVSKLPPATPPGPGGLAD